MNTKRKVNFFSKGIVKLIHFKLFRHSVICPFKKEISNGYFNKEILRILKYFIVLSFFLICFLITSCSQQTTDQKFSEIYSFFKIYEKNDEENYTAVDIKQTEDGGYIILGKIGRVPYLLKIDSKGKFLWDTKAEDFKFKGTNTVDSYDYIDPIGDIIIPNGENNDFLFFCHDISESRIITLLKVIKTNDITLIPFKFPESLPPSANVPVVAKRTIDNKVLLFTVNINLHKVKYLMLSPESDDWEYIRYELGKGRVFKIECEIKDNRHNFIELIQDSENRLYNFHGYLASKFEFTSCFGITTIDLHDNMFIKNILPLKKPFIATLWHSEDKFSGARIVNGTVSLFVNIEVSNIDDKEGNEQFELIESKPVFIKTMKVKEREIVFFSGSSKNNKIVLYAYESSTGDLLGKNYYGDVRLYEICGLLQTADSGLAILSTTFYFDIFNRICLFKLSNEDLEDITGL